MIRRRKSWLTLVLSALVSTALLTWSAFTPAAMLESRPVNAGAASVTPSPARIVSVLSSGPVNPADIDFPLIAGGIRDSQKFQDVVNEAGLVTLIIGVFVVCAGLLAYNYSD